ncbi:rod shape-determining protein MreC [Sulfurospirillum sp. 1307]|jgi:rod shape-determining protein MreC
MNKLKLLILIGLIALVSLKYGNDIKSYFVKFSVGSVSTYLDYKEFIQNKIDEHFSQANEIKKLREENQRLKASKELLEAFASHLNDVLKQKGVDKYTPKVKLVRSVSYVNLNDYFKVWIDYKDFNSSKIYGLLNNGASAGIVVSNNNNPMALLLGDPKSTFSVFVGKDKIPGIVIGKKHEVIVKYIPLWMYPKVGDEVTTSGLDGIFFPGVRVGVVKEVIKEEFSKSAIIEPYSKISVPLYYHIIEKN